MVVVTCSNGHRFPVNLEENKYRDYVMCPKCREKVVVRKKHIFSPSPTWEKEKREAKAMREELRVGKRRPIPITQPMISPIGRVYGLLAFSQIIKKREEEKEREQKRAKGQY